MSVNITLSHNKPLTQWRQVKGLLQNLAVRGGIVVGALWFPGSKIYSNYILLLHWWYWASAILMVVAVLVVGTVIANQVSSMTAESKNFGFIKSSKGIYESWSRKVNILCIVIPSLLFVGIYMGDWSLFIPLLIADGACAILFSTVAGFWDKLPKEITQDEAAVKFINDSSKNPVTQVLEDMKLKKSEEDKVTSAIAERLMNKEND